jgi:hypothetical protein
MIQFSRRFVNILYISTRQSLGKSLKLTGWLLKIIVPVSLAVSLLQHFGVIAMMAPLAAPLFSLVGLPGEAAIVFISSIFLPLYAPIAILATLDLSMRAITILALMCLITHNMVVETAIQKRTGSSAIKMFLIRLSSSFIAAFVLHLLLPTDAQTLTQISIDSVDIDFATMLWAWTKSTFWLSIKIILIISGLMILQNTLKNLNLLKYISNFFAPLMRWFGLSKSSAFLWFVAQTLGLAYGAAVMIENVENGEITKEDANTLNHHIAVNHSLLEDTLLFASIGVPVFWITIPRITMALIVVWSKKLLERIKN